MTNFTPISFDDLIQEILKLRNSSMKSIYFEDDVLKIKVEHYGQTKELTLSREDYQREIGGLLEVSFEDSRIYNSKYYEVAIVRASETPALQLNNIIVEDDSNGTSFRISKASRTFFWYYLSLMKKTPQSFANLLDFQYSDYELDNFEGSHLLDFLYEHKFYSSTAKLTSINSRNNKFFETILDSYSYILSYQINSTFRVLENIGQGQRFRGGLPNRISAINELVAPRRKYDKTLVLYYTRSIASPDASSKFLSLYHILEHEYDKVAREETIKFVSNRIASAGFSYKNSANVDSLISEIVKRVKEDPYNPEEIVSSAEAGALKLLIMKYIGSKAELSRILGRDNVKHYTENGVSFCGVEKLDLSKDDESVCESIAKRIYAVRNAIVHSKSANPNKFIPYKNDMELVMEIPLLRVVAEKIIESNATDL